MPEVKPVRLDTLPQYKEFQDLLACPIFQRAAEAKQARRPGFSDISREVFHLSNVLRGLGPRSFVQPFRGCNVLHQALFAVHQAKDFCGQYEDETHSPMVLQEVQMEQRSHILTRLLTITDVLKSILTDVSVTVLRKIEGLRTGDAPSCPSSPSNRSPHSPSHHGTKSLLQLLNGNGSDSLISEATIADWTELESMLQSDTSRVNTYGSIFNLLHIAVLWQDSFAVALLLGHGADVNALTRGDSIVPSNSTALHLAAIVGSAQMVRLLLAWGASTTIPNSQGGTCLQVATTQACAELFSNRQAVRAASQEACSAAHSANDAKLQKLILTAEIPLDVKYQRSSRFFMIHHVAHGNSLETYELLIEAGASALLKTSEKQLPSAVATGNSNTAVATAAQEEEAACVRVSRSGTFRLKRQSSSPRNLSPLLRSGSSLIEKLHSVKETVKSFSPDRLRSRGKSESP
eukprot:GGOE01047523.1.p1 GENE.GGOE01047523.1~~GGOE01047523.1.p1  ORF type:complete len:474 (+),score=161.06 GGOE01047523.1:40-1422(+)